MNELIQSGILTEIRGPQCMSYLLNDNSLFMLSGYKVLKSQEKGHFVRVSKLLYNGKIKFTYFTEEAVSFKSIVPSLSCDSFITVLANLMSSVVDIVRNGFLNISNVNMEFNRIYINPSTLSVSFIYFPVAERLSGTTVLRMPALDELRTNLIKLITSAPNLVTKRLNDVCEWLADGNLTFEDVYQKICGKKGGSDPLDEPAVFPVSYGSRQPEMKISTANAPERITLRVNKPEYVIGKNPMAVDGCLSFNNAISRVHCKIIWRNGAYYVEDLKSANGTYVNQHRLKPNQLQMLKDGSILRLANSDFIVRI